jgi:hypothetical protein
VRAYTGDGCWYSVFGDTDESVVIGLYPCEVGVNF